MVRIAVRTLTLNVFKGEGGRGGREGGMREGGSGGMREGGRGYEGGRE